MHQHANSITLAYKSLVSTLLRSGVVTPPLQLQPWVMRSEFLNDERYKRGFVPVLPKEE